MDNKTNLRVRFSEKEAAMIFAGNGTLTKTHKEDGRNYQIKITSALPPISNEPIFNIAIKELASDAERAEVESLMKMDNTGNEDRVNYLVTMELCFDDPMLDFDEDWCLRSLKDKGLSESEVFGLSVDAFRDGLKNHLVGGGNYVITKITDDKTDVEAQIEHYNKLKALYHKFNIL